MSDETAVKVDHLHKTFKLPHERQTSVKGVLINFMRRGKSSYEKQKVLDDVSFEIKKGEFFGIVGRNGSGKSTLLKLLAGIYTADKGGVHIDGTLTPFIELGVGFNQELTGRENVFLNGALLGFNRKEMLAMYDDIVEFAELEKFMDQKLKNYSSGMQVRLAFSIAIRVNTEILLLDEVLAVGDSNFQKKCLEVFDRYKASKKTVLLVTHDMDNVRRFCDRALLLSEGKIIEIGTPAKVAAAYTKLNQAQYDQVVQSQNQKKAKTKLRLNVLHADGGKSIGFKSGETLKLQFEWPKGMIFENLGVAIMRENGEYLFGCNTIGTSVELGQKHAFNCDIRLALGPGKYHLMYGAFGATKYDVVELIDDGPAFTIGDDQNEWEGLVYMDNKWYK